MKGEYLNVCAVILICVFYSFTSFNSDKVFNPCYMIWTVGYNVTYVKVSTFEIKVLLNPNVSTPKHILMNCNEMKMTC